jgi:ParB-like chromosome segregation protein Spo0J
MNEFSRETSIDLAEIRLDGGTQVRVELLTGKVAEYAEKMEEGEEFPALTVFHDGSHYWLADGFHRWHAASRAGLTSIKVTVLSGTVDDAQIYAFGANAKRGIPTSPEDNRSIVQRMFEHPISKDWTNAAIARHIGLSKMTVGRIKNSLQIVEPEVKTITNRGRTFEVPTESLSRKPKKEKEEKVKEEQDQNNELADTINDLVAENQRLKDAVAVGQWDASEIEKIDVQDTITELREQIRFLEIDNKALRDSRDMFQSRNAELMGTVKSLQAKIKKLEG